MLSNLGEIFAVLEQSGVKDGHLFRRPVIEDVVTGVGRLGQQVQFGGLDVAVKVGHDGQDLLLGPLGSRQSGRARPGQQPANLLLRHLLSVAGAPAKDGRFAFLVGLFLLATRQRRALVILADADAALLTGR